MQIATQQARIQISGTSGNGGGVLAIRVSGLVTAGTIDDLRRFLVPLADRASAVWVDYTRSLVVVSDLELQGLVAPIAKGSRSVPMAWAVADAGVEALWARQSFRLALHGHRRFVAGGVAAAAQWAHDQALMASGPASR